MTEQVTHTHTRVHICTHMHIHSKREGGKLHRYEEKPGFLDGALFHRDNCGFGERERKRLTEDIRRV